jgi:hypothetical protein
MHDSHLQGWLRTTARATPHMVSRHGLRLAMAASVLNPSGENCAVDDEMPCGIVLVRQSAPAPITNAMNISPLKSQLGRKLRSAVIYRQEKLYSREDGRRQPHAPFGVQSLVALLNAFHMSLLGFRASW